MVILSFYADFPTSDNPDDNLVCLPSENFLYKPSHRGPYLYKDPKIVKYQEYLKEQFSLFLRDKQLPPRDIVKKLSVFYIFGLNKDSYWIRDLTNLLKATEDAILSKNDKSLLPYDDSLVVSEAQVKVITSEIDCVTVFIGIMREDEDSFDVLINLINTAKGFYER